jgi:ABC-2 type transport system ATP-binding protein
VLTVMEHLRLVARLCGVTDLAGRAAALEELQLTGKEQSLPGELSRGMRQKVVIACGLVATRRAAVRRPHRSRSDRHPTDARIRCRPGEVGRGDLLSSHLCTWSRRSARASSSWTGRRSPTGFAELASRADLATAGSNLEQIFLRVTGQMPV